MNIKFLWVKGHTDLLNCPLSQDKRLNMGVDQHADKTISDARGPTVVRLSCSRWDVEIASLSLIGGKLTSQYKDNIKTQLHNKTITELIKEKESWTQQTFDTSTGVLVVPLLKDCPKTDRSMYPKHASTTGMQAQ
jgi:hypothetical protein